jgi:hypothetical protein
MAAAVDSARATLLDGARRRDAGVPLERAASTAKLVATDVAMRVTTDAVQVVGGYGYTRDFPVEPYMREAKIMQIFEGTNQDSAVGDQSRPGSPVIRPGPQIDCRRRRMRCPMVRSRAADL